MIPLRGDVRLKIADPYETPNRRYTELRKLLGQQASDLEVQFEELEETFGQVSYGYQLLGRAGRIGGGIDIKEVERQGKKVVDYRVIMRLEGHS